MQRPESLLPLRRRSLTDYFRYESFLEVAVLLRPGKISRAAVFTIASRDSNEWEINLTESILLDLIYIVGDGKQLPLLPVFVMQSLRVNDHGAKIGYFDSGAPLTDRPYSTLVLIHGHTFNACASSIFSVLSCTHSRFL